MNRKSKEKYKKVLPGFALKTYHQMRIGLQDMRFSFHRARHKGKNLHCPVCNQYFDAFVTGGENIPILRKHHVTSAGVRKNCVCPKCRSKERDRFLFLFLLHETNMLHEPVKMLHFAPEPSLKWIFSNRGTIEYTNADLDAEKADMVVDITRMPFKDDCFELIICNHVLEHVPNDMGAFKEMSRVLMPHGIALLQVPIGLGLEKTKEDPTIVRPEDREKHFGQLDHVRIYGLDFQQRLEEAGLEVKVFRVRDMFTEEMIETHALIPEERLFVCTKP